MANCGWRGAALRVLALVLLAVSVAVYAAPQFPALSGRVVDEAGLLSAATRAQLTQLSEQQETATTRSLVIVTVKSLQGYPIEDYGYQLGRHWGVGQKGKNNGVLLIIAPKEREVRIEVGYGLEGQLTDALASNIIQSVIVPRFKSGDYEGGVVAGAQAVIAALAGEEPQISAEVVKNEVPSMSIPALLIVGVVVGQILAMFLSRVLAGTLAGVIMAGVAWIFTGAVLMSVFSALMIFVFVALSGGRRGGFLPGGRGGGGFGGGGFSGGGGSFGGGGASGRW